jgi:threonine synthase
MVKRMFNDKDVNGPLTLSAVNSINWARLMAQVVYYFYAALRLGGPERKVAFSVPTGNFGDVFAGYVAAQMGLPIERLIVATNINDILHRALSKGDYSVLGVTPTASPSMDIQVSSNFERLLFDLEGRDGATTGARMKWFEQMGKMVLSSDMRKNAALLTSARTDAEQMSAAMRGAYVATDNAPTTGGDGSTVFSMDLTTNDAKAYFTANPTADTVNAAFQIAYTVDTIERRTTPLPIVLQNDYLQNQ